MSGGVTRALFFCLSTGAALGCLLLLFQAVRILLRPGRLFTALLDLLYCCICAVTVFLCALAMDHGRLRLFQAVFQLLGGWAAAAALSPLTGGLAGKLRKIFCKVSAGFQERRVFLAAHFRRRRAKPVKKSKKTGEKPKKAKKKT